MEYLGNYDFVLSYHPDKANVDADALSRRASVALSSLIGGYKASRLHNMVVQQEIYDRVLRTQQTNERCIALRNAVTSNSGPFG